MKTIKKDEYKSGDTYNIDQKNIVAVNRIEKMTDVDMHREPIPHLEIFHVVE